jgi:hypothetical protein
MLARVATVLAIIAVGVLAITLLRPPAEPAASAADAAAAALMWVGAGETQPPRREGDDWEVDVRRADGSLVEVTLGPDLALRQFDEERGPADSAAPDDLVGPRRAQAVAAALRAAGRGDIRYVERERDGTIEIGVLRADRTALEVELDRQLRVTDVDDDTVADE